MFSIEELLNLAVQIEKNAESVFRKAASNVSNSSLSSLLDWLAEEEIKHAKLFSELRLKAMKTAKDPEAEVLGKKILEGILGDQTFSLGDVDFSRMEQVQDVLETAIEFENDTILFYEMIQSFVREEDLEQLKLIIEEERSHVNLLLDFLKSDFLPRDDGSHR